MPDRLTLVIHALNSGGAERVLATLASHWAETGRQVTLVTLAEEATDRYPLHPAVRRVGLALLQPSRSAWDALRNNWRRLCRLRAAIDASRPDAVVSFTDQMNVLTLLACRGAPWPVLIAERNDPRRQRMSRVWELLRRRTYPRCSVAVVQTEAVAAHVRQLVGQRPVFVIANAVAASEPERRARDASAPPRPYAVAMGRLDDQKGFDLLIDAFARVAADHPDLDLRIIGEGPRRESLEQLASQRGLSARVHLLGWLDQPAAVLREAEFFVLSSRWEGFPNALLEAMACGLPAISFACDSGPAEIVRHGVDGLLVPPDDVAALAEAVDALMRNPELRRQMGTAAREVVRQFGYDAFFARWDEALDQATHGKCSP
ncbi:MAG: glycosyltransferase family 4 protein [Pirellulaceae bacterium]|nr:glycosyltransferase family 4 protein [Pirellulaceae bacterium]